MELHKEIEKEIRNELLNLLNEDGYLIIPNASTFFSFKKKRRTKIARGMMRIRLDGELFHIGIHVIGLTAGNRSFNVGDPRIVENAAEFIRNVTNKAGKNRRKKTRIKKTS